MTPITDNNLHDRLATQLTNEAAPSRDAFSGALHARIMTAVHKQQATPAPTDDDAIFATPARRSAGRWVALLALAASVAIVAASAWLFTAGSTGPQNAPSIAKTTEPVSTAPVDTAATVAEEPSYWAQGWQVASDASQRLPYAQLQSDLSHDMGVAISLVPGLDYELAYDDSQSKTNDATATP